MKKFPTLLLMNVFLFTGLVGYSFIRAYNEGPWLVPADAPPISNMATPINVGVQTQSKSGNLAANIFAAFTQMRSNFYCDALGNNCTAASDLGDNGSGVQLSGGAGILLNPNVITTVGTISADSGYLQRRVTSSCPSGQSIRAINSDGSVVCEAIPVCPALPTNCIWKSQSYSNGAKCVTGTSFCTVSATTYSYQTCSNGSWSSGAICSSGGAPAAFCP